MQHERAPAEDRTQAPEAWFDSLLDYTPPPAFRAKMQEWVRAKMQAESPWLDEARQHVNDVVIARLVNRLGREPQWSAMGFRVLRNQIWHHRLFLTPILSVGIELARGQPMPLIETDLSVFNHIPAKTATFDATAFDAGLALARGPGEDGEMDLTPVVKAFERQLLKRGMRGFNEGGRPVPYLSATRWDSVAKLKERLSWTAAA